MTPGSRVVRQTRFPWYVSVESARHTIGTAAPWVHSVASRSGGGASSGAAVQYAQSDVCFASAASAQLLTLRGTLGFARASGRITAETEPRVKIRPAMPPSAQGAARRRWRCEQPTELRSRQREPDFDATPRPRPSSDRRVPCSPIISLVGTRLTGVTERTSTAFARRASPATWIVSVCGHRSDGRRGVDRVAVGGGHVGSRGDFSRTFHTVGTRAFIEGSCEKSPGRTSRGGL
jgi:hypothetical protein